MKKIILILTIFAFTGQELMAQLGSGGSGTIYRNTGGADRGSTSGVFGTQGDWSTDLVISEKTPATAANDYVGPTHNGMGATGWGSFVAGAYNRASGAGAVAIGFHNVAGPTGSDISNIPPSSTNLGGQFAVGYGTQATGHATFSAGQGTTASGNYSTAFGRSTTASGSFSTAMGDSTTATDYASLVIGQYNSSGSSATSATTFSTSAPAFVIGNGTSGSLSDAFKVMFNGDATVSNDLNS